MDLINPGFGLVPWQLSGMLMIGSWAYAIFDWQKSEFEEPNQKLIWIIFVVFVPFLGPLFYLSLPKKGSMKRKFQFDFNLFSSDKINS